MREIIQEYDEDRARVAAAEAKVSVQTETLKKLSLTDPSREVAQRLLDLMRYGASSTKIDQSMSDYVKSDR